MTGCGQWGRKRWRRAAVTLAFAGTGCASSAPSQFPSAMTLAQLSASPIALQPPAAVVDVDEWKLTGPLPDAIEPAVPSPGSNWDRLLVDVAAPRGPGQAGLVTAAGQCVAREIGLFRAAQSGDPPQALVRFIGARCGIAAADLVFGCREEPALRADRAAALDPAAAVSLGGPR